MADEEKDEESHHCGFGDKEVLIPGPPIPGGRVCLRHTADHKLAVGALVEVPEGSPIPENAHVVEQEDGVLKVGPSVAELKASHGPAQVATPAYREGHDRIFGKKPTVGLA